MKFSTSSIILRRLSRSLRSKYICRQLTNQEALLAKPTDSFFITTPIFYVNAAPHVGHLYTALIADAAHRWQLFLGCPATIFATGTDEHGLKVQQAAAMAQMDPLDYCSQVSDKFRDLFRKAGVRHTDYIRTTESRHKAVVCKIWAELEASGHIYKGTYNGWYCVADESFVPQSRVEEIVDDAGIPIKVSLESGQPVEWICENNYMFRLSAFADDLLRWLSNDVIQPRQFRAIVEQMIRDGLQDLSISRGSDRLQWGIPVPGDDSQTIYVWVDALLNYLTVAGYPPTQTRWPPDCQVIGKDILKFHAIYWPALLLALGLELPRRILCHSHWLYDHQKMSKSRGNVVDPHAALETYTVDGFRYFLLREGVPHSDGNYSDEKVVKMLNAELGDTLGNLLSRCTAPALNPAQIFPPINAEILMIEECGQQGRDLLDKVSNLAVEVAEHYDDCNFYRGLDAIMSCLRDTNAFIQSQAPWTLKKRPEKQRHLETVLHIALESLRVSGLLLQPVMPALSDSLLTRLGVTPSERTAKYLNCHWGDKGCNSPYENRPLGGDKSVLFQKIVTK